MARIAVIGLGPVGHDTATRLHFRGHTVFGFDHDATKLRENVLYTTDTTIWGAAPDYIVVCIGTPEVNGVPSYTGLQVVAHTLDPFRADAKLIVRSTTLPGTIENIFSRWQTNVFHVPEFRREVDFGVKDNPYAVVGGNWKDRGAIGDLFFSHWTTVHYTTIREAESVKHAVNAWHAMKVAFTNELGSLLEPSAMEVVKSVLPFDQDHYLTPGEPYGGPCLTKDIHALQQWSLYAYPLLNALPLSNERHHEICSTS